MRVDSTSTRGLRGRRGPALAWDPRERAARSRRALRPGRQVEGTIPFQAVCVGESGSELRMEGGPVGAEVPPWGPTSAGWLRFPEGTHPS